MVRRAKAVFVQLKRERCLCGLSAGSGSFAAASRRLRRRYHVFPFTRRSHPADRQLVILQPPDHIEIDHRDGLVEREDGIVDVKVRAEQALFLAAEGDEDERAFIVFLFARIASRAR